MVCVYWCLAGFVSTGIWLAVGVDWRLADGVYELGILLAVCVDLLLDGDVCGWLLDDIVREVAGHYSSNPLLTAVFQPRKVKLPRILYCVYISTHGTQNGGDEGREFRQQHCLLSNDLHLQRLRNLDHIGGGCGHGLDDSESVSSLLGVSHIPEEL
ncbi:hypothetical protein NDU88_001725 [Pleurodeles waltl]|uniref:Uncharacterized protein n=1 Tax=Pleurodeles waltl TaxID=8319 RepID=A0AAV7P4R1_PLEWA|nr:hypothetical protein NDU88_001725 [Pleurodeles waltl]